MKVLIMSHNPITTYNSMGRTFLGLFSEFEEEELCQFYVYPTIPNVHKCHSYYRVTDRNLLQSFIFWKSFGQVIDRDDIKINNSLYEKKYDNLLYSNKERKKEVKLFARNIVWTLGHWFTKRFESWIESENPDVIFAAPGLSTFFYDIIQKVSKKYNLPIILYICDDFYFSSEKKGNNKLEKKYYKILQKKIRNLIATSSNVVSICKPMTKLYSKEFNCDVHTVFSGTNLPLAESFVQASGRTIRYFGNLKLGRGKSLLEIGKALDKINQIFHKNYVLEIYSMDCFEDKKTDVLCMKHMGFVNAEELVNLMKESILLLHVEAFEAEYEKRTKYSISTKIPDILSTGVPLLAYGPRNIASMEHLKDNKCAFLAFNSDMLYDELKNALLNDEERIKRGINAIETAKKYHSISTQSKLLKKIITETINC